MYYIYALQSKKDGRIYVGLSRDINKRLLDHNYGRVFSTKGYGPWKLFYKEFCEDRIEARKKEKYLKSGCGKEFLKSILPL